MKFLIALWALFLGLSAHAGLDLGVRAQSLGGAIRAQGSSNDVVFYNPAALVKERRISPEIDYLYNSYQRGHAIGVSIVDSSTSAWGLGIAYNAQFFPKSDLASAHLLYLSTAVPLGTDLFAVGGSISYAYDTKIGPPPYANFFNMDLALMATLPIGFSVAVVADHVINAKGREKSLGLTLASAYDFSALLPLPLSVSLDWSMDDVKSDLDLHHIVAAGAQFIVLNLVPIRLGFKSDQYDNKKLISLGSGLMFGSVSLDALYQQDLSIGKFRHFGMALRMAI